MGKANGDLRSLIRHVVCVDTKTGKIQWQKDIKAQGNEDNMAEWEYLNTVTPPPHPLPMAKQFMYISAKPA